MGTVSATKAAVDVEQINDNEHYITIEDNIYGYSKK